MKKVLAIFSAVIITVCFSCNSFTSYAAGRYKVIFSANGGKGKMSSVVFDGSTVSVLPANKYSRTGYRFRGWNTEKNGGGVGYADQGAVVYPGKDNLDLYACWEPQVYKIKFDGNGATEGRMNDQLISYDTPTELHLNEYMRNGYNFAGWMDSDGNLYADGQSVENLRKGSMRSTKVNTFSAGKPAIYSSNSFKSVQGSCVFTEGGHQYLVFAAGVNDASYYAGDLSHYETALVKYDLTTGKKVKSVPNLTFDHGNGICYNTDNGHLYIAEGGSLSGYHGDIMELDTDLNYLGTWHVDGISNVYAIAFSNHAFYVIGKAEAGGTYFVLVNQDFQVCGYNNISAQYQQGYCVQGIASDDNFVYAITACFDAYNWKGNQKINVFTLSGKYAGTWSIDVESEVEDISIDKGQVFITTNNGAKTTLYKTVFPNVTLKAQWVPY